jgi:spore maturation protein CgeB
VYPVRPTDRAKGKRSFFLRVATMKSLADLGDIMRDDWNRRVQHDYRFWVSNDLAPSSVMWEEGARDFAAVTDGIRCKRTQTALEIGSGVGRMLRAASEKFGRVIGVDVSPLAIDKAKELLGSGSNIQLVVNSGYDLSSVMDASVDFAWSFASLAHMPARVFASYLVELKRVLKADGRARLQVFIGQTLDLQEVDTLRLRAFRESNLRDALQQAGLELEAIESVELPLSELLGEMGLQPVLIKVSHAVTASNSLDTVVSALCPHGEGYLDTCDKAGDFEAWLALNYADRLFNDGDFDRARFTLEYVARYCRTSSLDIKDTLDRISAIAAKRDEQSRITDPDARVEIYARNAVILRERFPALLERLNALSNSEVESVLVTATVDGPVLWCGQTCLDHPEKPKAAGESWARRSLNDVRFLRASHLVVLGFGAGYHVESLIARGTHRVSCVEPSLLALKRALEVRDLRSILRQIVSLEVSERCESLECGDQSEILTRPQVAILDSAFSTEVTKRFYSRRGLSTTRPKIAVLGPLQGGTLPIGQYTTSALTALGQRARGIDMSGFNKSFELVDSLIFDSSRRDVARHAYVETLSSMLLESFAEKPIDILICMAQAPISARALRELRQQGVVTVLWFVEDYLRFTYWKEMAKYYDFVFTIQKGDCIDAIRAAGAGSVHYLPTACDPRLHIPMNLSKEDREKWGSPISFVGAGYHNRQQAFASLSHYPFKIWGSEWPGCKPFDRMVQEASRRISPEEYIKIFNASDINLNLHSSSERDGIDPSGDFLNPRTFELASCEAFQLVDERALLHEAFVAGEEVVTFNSIADLRDKIDYYSSRPEERRRIARNGRERALRDHTYEKRIEEMLSVIYSREYQRLKARQDSSPWSEMIRRAESDPELQQRCQRAFERGEEPILDGLVADITTGKGDLTETEQKLLFLFHVRKQIIRMEYEGAGVKNS